MVTMKGKSLKWTDAERAEVTDNILFLSMSAHSRDDKYNRNMNRYYNNGRYGSRASIWNPDNQVLGYNRTMFDDSSTQTKLNVIKSAADTICSKLSQARVRPFFSAVRGDYQTIKACRAAQDRFDAMFDRLKIYERAPQIALGSLLYDAGHFWVDEDNEEIQIMPHWCVYVDPKQYQIGGLASCRYGMIFRQQYPLSFVVEQFGAGEYSKNVPNINRISGHFVVYYNFTLGFKYYVFNTEIVWKSAISYKKMPITEMWWTKPMVGYNTTCLADDLYTIQVQIDEIQLRIDQALRQSPFNTVFTPAGSGIKATMLTNEAASVVEYIEGPEGGTPIVATPAPISGMYLDLLKVYINQCYELAGISQLSAQSKKPTGLDSGVAIQTFEDVESERHNVTSQSYIHMFVDLADIVIDTFKSDSVLPSSITRASVSWADIRKQKELFHIQFSAGSALAKDPATKIEQIQKLQAIGINLQPILPQLLEIPDIETAYSVTTAGYDYVQSVIERCAETGDSDFLPIAPLEMMFSETVRWIMRLAADDQNKKYLSNLKKLLEAIKAKQDEIQPAAPDATVPVDEPVNPMTAPGIPAAMPQ